MGVYKLKSVIGNRKLLRIIFNYIQNTKLMLLMLWIPDLRDWLIVGDLLQHPSFSLH